MGISCEGSSDRDRDRHRGFGCIASCVPSPLCCKPLSILLFRELMSEWNDVMSHRQRRYERKSSSIWTACSGVAMRSVQDPVIPQQRHVPWLRQAKGRETGRVHQRVGTACGLATAEFIPLWKFLWRGGSLRQQTEGTGPSSCDGQTTTGTGQSRGSAVEGTPRLTQGTEQAKDVQMADAQIADVQCDLQPPSERVAHRSGAYRLSRRGSRAHGGREWTADADGYTACVPGGATGQCASLG